MNIRKSTLTAACAAALIVPATVNALTIKTHDQMRGGSQFTVGCGKSETKSMQLPAGATNVAVIKPKVGDKVKDGFGDKTLATITAVDVRTEGDRPVMDVTATGSDYICDDPIASQYDDWETNGVTFTAEYDLVEEVKVLFSDEQGGLHPKQKPKRITATADTGWKGLHWNGWGGRKAVGKGTFVGRRIVSHNGDAGYQDVPVPVEVKLSRPEICGNDRYYYTKLKTTFLKSTPKEIQRQAKPPGTAGCLD
jgi:hypothetical protein